MKRKIVLFLLLIILIFQTACHSENLSNPNVYTVTKDGIEYTVDHENQAITDGEHTFYYAVNNNEIRITYPDGSSYGWTREENGGYGGYSMDYIEGKYVQGDVLYDILMEGNPSKKVNRNPGKLLAAMILIGFGLWNLLSPESSWYVSHGWRYKNVEPSEMALSVKRIGGVVALIVAIVLLLSSC